MKSVFLHEFEWDLYHVCPYPAGEKVFSLDENGLLKNGGMLCWWASEENETVLLVLGGCYNNVCKNEIP